MALLVYAEASAQGPATSDATLDRVAQVEIFAFGPIGYAGITSQGEKDYKLILSRPSAAGDFELLLSTGNAQANSYALVGIRATNPGRFKKLLSLLRDSKASVTTEIGCIVSHESLGSILQHIEAGDYSKEKSPK